MGPLLRCLTLLAALLWLGPAAASLDQEMKSAFDGMINATPGDAYMTQRRGVISGGSLVMRNRISNPNLISFVPPSVKAGCNGIDLFGGSFSFINTEQLTQLMRNIAQAAAGYAFQLAIEGVCPTCAQVMTKLQKDIQFINGLMKNSCDAAKALVDGSGLGGEIRNASAYVGKHLSTDLNTKQGFIQDWFAGAENGGDKSPSETAIQHGQAPRITGNVMTQALDGASAVDWYEHGDAQMKMVIASLTGMVIVGTKDGAAPDGGTDLDYRTVPPILKIRDFIEGGSVQVYQCPDDACLDPTKQTIALTGMRDRVRSMLFGGGVCATCTGGIVRKLASRTGGGAFTADEQRFIQASSPGALGLLNQLAAQLGSAALVAERMVDVLAVEMSNAMVDEMFDTARNAVMATGKTMDTAMMAQLRDLRAQLNEERRVSGEAVAGVSNLMQIYANVERSLHGRPQDTPPK